MLKAEATWMTLFAAVLLAGCNRHEPMPEYPYDPPRAGEKDVTDVNLVGAILGHSIDARLPDDNAAFTLHLADIMAPARGQKWHSEAVAALDALVKGKRGRARFFESVVPSKDIDAEHGVTVIGRVFVDGKDISWELVGSGNAWVWEEKSNDLELKKLQEWARKNRKGLWALPESDREPPWEFMVRRMRNQGEESRPK